jgi:HK97 family phage prohead protease
VNTDEDRLAAREEQLRDENSEDRAELSSKTINDLPDSDFAYIESGGTKDSEGKTVPRDLRHFPIHDEAHVRNALARAPQSPFGDKAMPKILAAAKKFGIEASEKKSADVTEVELVNNVFPISESTKADPRRRKKDRHRAVALMPEVRHWSASGLEIRSASKTDEIVITGSPIVFDTPYAVRDMFGEFQEMMAPGVARQVMEDGADVRFLFNHDGLPLARTLAGTLTLTETDGTVDFEARLDARQQLANDLAIAIERKDVTQMSCGFIVARDEWDDDEENRTIHQFADLLDVSAVTYPASPTTSIQIAQRMALEMPVESRARLRRLLVDTRAGAALSNANKERVASAIEALLGMHEAGGGSVRDFDPDNDGDNDATLEGDTDHDYIQQDGTEGDLPEGQGFLDGSGARSSEPVVDPGEQIRRKALRVRQLQLEARRLRRKS